MGGIIELDANEDITLETIDAEDADDNDEAVPAKVKEVIEVVTAAKLMTDEVTTAATTITATQMPKASAPRIRKGVVIKDPEETTTASVIVHSKAKSKVKGKGIIVEEPKPIKRQAHIEQDEAYVRELEAELNANINWNNIMEQVKRKEKQYNTHYTSTILDKGENEIKEEGSKRKRENDSAGSKEISLDKIHSEQILNNVRLEVKEESKMSLELLSFGVDAVEDFKEIYAKGLLLLVED
nr:hypothetical protein [Tanacetum cinerariifolium]